jgi:HAE1 family hydrophobic/amphiphilic exporter-1
VAVFLPIAFMGGIVGQFLKSFGITMAATIMVSMLVSFTLTPMLAARWFNQLRPRLRYRTSRGSARKNGSAPVFYRCIESVYLIALRFSLRHRWVVLVTVMACVASLPYLFQAIPKNFMPNEDSSDFQLSVLAPEGTSLEATQMLVTRIARDVRRLDGVRYTIASVADTEARNPYQGTVYVRLVDIAQREYSQMDVMDFMRNNVLPKYADENLRLSVSSVAGLSGGGMGSSDIQYMVGGPDMTKLERYAKVVMADLRKVPGAVDVDSSLSTGKPQYGISVDRPKAARLGVSVADVANTLRLLVAGDKVSDYSDKGEQYEVHIRALRTRATGSMN